MKTAVLVSGVVLLGLVGGAAGYEAGRLTENTSTGSGTNDLVQPPDTPLVEHKLKTPKPNTVPGLKAKGMQFQGHTFTVRQRPRPSVRVSIDAPEGWQLTTAKNAPGEVKFLDPLRERGVRVEAGFPPDLTPEAFRDKLVGGLFDSQPPENDLRILEESSTEIADENGDPRSVATLIYTYIPNQTRRYVIVRWIATEGDKATVEMSITGLPQDADGLGAVLFEATKTVQLKN